MPKKNEIGWEEYEAITQYIYGALGEKYGIKEIARCLEHLGLSIRSMC